MATDNKQKGIDRIIDVIVSIAAVPVLVGALFKILHWPGANTMLMVGLLTEAGIFLITGLRYLFGSPDTSAPAATGFVGNVNVETKDYEGVLTGILEELKNNKNSGTGFSLNDANLTQGDVDKIKEGFLQLGNTAESIKKLNDAITNSSNDALKTQDELKTLADNLGKINKVYGGVLTAMKAE